MRKKCYDNPSVEIFEMLEESVLMASGSISGDILDTSFEYDNNPWS